MEPDTFGPPRSKQQVKGLAQVSMKSDKGTTKGTDRDQFLRSRYKSTLTAVKVVALHTQQYSSTVEACCVPDTPLHHL